MSNISERLTGSRIRDLANLLVKVQKETPAGRIVEPLLDLLVGGEQFDLKQNFLIKEPNVILLIFELLPHLPDGVQLEVWSTLGAILHQCLPNATACHQLGLTEKCLEFLSKTSNNKVAGYIVSVLEMLAGYSLSVKQLKGILSYLYTSPTDTTWARYSVLLIGALCNISVGVQPDVYFSFSGGHGCVLTLPPLSKWPGHSGFTISTWIRAEKPFDKQREYYKPIVYWFRTGRGLGYSAHFIGSNLVLETASKNAKRPQTHSIDYIFHSYQWHMITISYQYHRLKSSELCCYIDGTLQLSTEVTLPPYDERYDKCFLGGNHVATPDSVFQGQMAALYMWKECLDSSTVSALHKLGPSYKSQFKFEAEVDVPLTISQQKLLFNRNLSSSMMISYNAKAVDGQLCLEASPEENESYFVHSPHATMLEGVDPIITTSFHCALHSLGGIQTFFPFFSQLDISQMTLGSGGETVIDFTLSVKLLSLVFQLALNSITYMYQVVQMKALELISNLLENVSPFHLTHELMSAIFDLLRYLSNAPYGQELLLQLIEYLLMNSKLWKRAEAKIQIYLYSQLATEFSMQCLGSSKLDLREIVTVSYLMYVLKEYYSLSGDDSDQDIRPYILLIIKQFTTRGKGIRSDELLAILSYLASVPEEVNLFDVLKLLLSLVFEDTNLSLLKLLKSGGGIEVATKLLTSRSEELRINALKIISKILHQSSSKEQMSLLDSGLLVVIKEKLLSSGQMISIPVFNTLIKLMLNCPSKQVIETRYITLLPSHKIAFIGVFQLLIELVLTLNSDQDHRHPLLCKQLLLHMSNLCSWGTDNCSALLNLPHWFYWLYKLDDESEAALCTSDDGGSVLQQLTHTVLMYALSEEEEGWRVWVESMSTLHTYTAQKDSMKSHLISSDSLQGDDSTSSLLSSEQTDSITSLASTPPKLHPSQLIDKSETNATSESVNSSIKSDGIPVLADGSNPIIKGSSNRGNKKMPKFVWTPRHRELLRIILTSVRNIMDRSSCVAGSSNSLKVSDPKQHLTLALNTIQIIVLSIDSLVNLVGGVKGLISESCNIRSGKNNRRQLRFTEEDPSLSAESLLRLCLQVYHCFVFDKQIKFSIIEARMNMDAGGVVRQLLRMVLVTVSIDCIKANKHYSDLQARYNSHKQSIEILRHQSNILLKVIGVDNSCLNTYVQESLKIKLMTLKDCQKILSEDHISFLKKTLSKDSSSQLLISTIVYYLAVMCVAKYKCVLDSIEKEKSETIVAHSKTQRTHSASNDGDMLQDTPRNSAKSDRKSLGDDLSPDVWDDEVTSKDNVFNYSPQVVRSDNHEGSICSSLGSASDLQNIDEKAANFLGSEGTLHPPTVMHLSQAIDVSEQVDVSLKLVGSYFCQLITENRYVLSKVLTTSDGRQLLSEAVFKLAERGSVIEITMLLCSQEWQNCLQKTAGKYFNSLLIEGKQVAQFSESYFRSLASDITNFVKKGEDEDTEKFTSFEEHLSVFLSSCIQNTQEELRMRKADVIRHSISARNLWRQISTMVDQYGSYDFTPLKPTLLWRLDMKEDYCRRRMKLMPNPNGSMHTEALRSLGEGMTEDQRKIMFEPDVFVSPVFDEEENESDSLPSNIDTDNEQVPQVSFECKMIVLTNLVTGKLSFTKETLAFTANDQTEEISSALSDIYPISDRWSLEYITAIFSRKYLHQNKAIEIFFFNKTSVFLVFADQKEVKRVVNVLPKVGIGPNYGLPQTRAVSLMLPDNLFKRCNLTEKWMKRSISNFEYLMGLNTIAGRSFNDLSQYPVFPWILKDYTSEELDLKNSNIFRDLSKPIGAQDPNRQAKFQERYENWENDVIPAFHYGTHYSTLAFILHWLVRVEPFTSLHVDLHDGYFDHGSRLFSSISRSWNNCQVDSSDVKELIPELFYLPEMLTNENKFMLGHDEHGEMGEELPEGESRTINDVLLPPWAKTAADFIEIHRQALESDFVSINLHMWIDLIFGYKQTGIPAQESTNVFYYLTYLGSVNWKAITEDNQLKAIEQQILHFGQTPYQLLKEPHPIRQQLTKEFPPQSVSPSNPAVIVDLPLTLDIPIGLVQLSSTSTFLLSVSYHQLFAKHKFSYVAGTSNQPPVVTIDQDSSNLVNLYVRLGDPLDQSISITSVCLASTPNVDTVFVCGFWDSSFKAFSTDNGQLLQSVFGHRGVVTCISYSQDEGLCAVGGDGIIATGSHDVTVLLWKWSGKLNRVVSQLQTQQGSVTPIAILNGHERTVTCVALSATLGVVASGTKNGWCLLHSTSGELLHKLVPSSSIWSHPHMIVYSPKNHFIIHYADQKGCLTAFSCNGKQLAYRPLNEPALGLAVSSDGNYIVFGGFSGRIYVLNAHSLDVVYMYEKCDSSIRALSLSTDNRFIFAGLSSGTVVVLATHFWRQ